MTAARPAQKTRPAKSRPAPSPRPAPPDRPIIAFDTLGSGDRAVLDAMIAVWLQTSAAGRDVLENATVADATEAIYRNVQAGLMRLLWTPATAGRTERLDIQLTASGWADITGGGSA